MLILFLFRLFSVLEDYILKDGGNIIGVQNMVEYSSKFLGLYEKAKKKIHIDKNILLLKGA